MVNMAKPINQAGKTPENERFLAFAGSQQCALAVLDRRNRMREISAEARPSTFGEPRWGNIPPWTINLYRLQSMATDFCSATMLLKDFLDWSESFGDFKKVILPEFRALDWDKIRDVRNMRVHVGEYFRGRGRDRDRWFEHLPDSSADASAIVNTSIGNRVDYEEVGGIVERMLGPMLNEPVPFPPSSLPPPVPAQP